MAPYRYTWIAVVVLKALQLGRVTAYWEVGQFLANFRIGDHTSSTMFLVKNLDKQTSRLTRVAVYALVFVGVCLIVLVRLAMLKAGASANAALLVVLVVVLYSVLVNVVLVKKTRASIRPIDTERARGKTAGSTRKEKLRILVRLVFQASLFFLGSWLLIGGSHDMGELGKMPLAARLLIVGAAGCLLIWRVIRARRLLMQMDQQGHEVA